MEGIALLWRSRHESFIVHDAPARSKHRAENHPADLSPLSTSLADVRCPCSPCKAHHLSNGKGPLRRGEGCRAQRWQPRHQALDRLQDGSGVARTSHGGCVRRSPRLAASVGGSLRPSPRSVWREGPPTPSPACRSSTLGEHYASVHFGQVSSRIAAMALPPGARFTVASDPTCMSPPRWPLLRLAGSPRTRRRRKSCHRGGARWRWRLGRWPRPTAGS